MSNLNNTSLKANIDANVYENVDQEITGQHLNNVLTNINDSKASLSDDNAFTGNSTVPTQTSTDNSTKIATTEFVQTNLLTKLDATIRQIASTAVYFDKPSIFINGTSPLTGNITLNTAYTQSPAMWAVMLHNSGTAPTFDSNFVQTTDSLDYVISANNYIEFYCVSATKILYRIKQEGNGINSVFLKKNSAITGATHTKITYDTNGLVTSGTDATTSDIAEGSNLYYTDSRTRATALTGLSVAGGTVTNTDSVLTAFGKLQNQLNAVASPMIYQGTWNANTNSPTLTSSTGTKGYTYKVTTSGSTNLDGITDWKSGDFAVFNGATWDKWDTTDAVTSVNGYTGTVVLGTADISDSTNKRYVTDAELTVLSNTSGTNTGDETTATIKTKLGSANTSSDGYLLHTDWNTFNSKQSALSGTGFVKISGTTISYDNSTYLTANQSITLSGDVSGSGTTAITTTVSNASVIAKLLTGFTSGAGTVSATDSILGAFQKIVGNISALVTGVSSVFGRTGAVTAQSGDYNTSQVTENTNLYFTNARAIASTLTSYTAGAGTVSSSDTIIGGLQKLDGNIATKANATPSVQNVTSSATVTPTSSNDLVIITAQAVGLTLANPTGTFAEGQPLMIRIKDNGTAQTIAFGTNYRAIGITLPTTTVAGKYMYLGIMYNNVDSKWDILGLNNQA
jgi:hypothetical protein